MSDVPEHVRLPDGVEPPPQLLDALWRYEAALAAGDLDLLSAFFADGPYAMRGDANGLLVGREQIDAFRAARSGSPERDVIRVEVRPITEVHAYVTSVNAPSGGGRGLVTQLWERSGRSHTPGGWVIAAAHVSAPVPAVDGRTWRVVGTPLVATHRPGGPLAGQTVAVKDLFAVAGHPTGGGVPAFLAESAPAEAHADAVALLVDAGADIVGIAQTDQFAYSIAGINDAYGTPVNVAVPGAIPGGSSSGPATAVASGQASIGLGSDTAGSIRVPASYQGLWGLRPTHGAVSLAGALPLAPAYDTAGWLTRDAATLTAAARVSLPEPHLEPTGTPVISPALLAAADLEVRAAFTDTIAALVAAGVLAHLDEVELPPAPDLFAIFRPTQSAEAHRSWGAWIIDHPDALGRDIAARFDWAASVTSEQETHGLAAKASAASAIADALEARILLLPSASSVAPPLSASADRLDQVRQATLGMTAVAGITGRPALSAPLMAIDGAPAGLCLVGPPASELALIETAARWQQALAS